MLEKIAHIVTVIRKNGKPEAGAASEDCGIRAYGTGKVFAQQRANTLGFLAVRNVSSNHNEFVSPDSGGDVGAAHGFLYPLGGFLRIRSPES